MLGFDHKYIEKAKNVQEKKAQKDKITTFFGQDYNIFLSI